jgi:hypothetical protein
MFEDRCGTVIEIAEFDVHPIQVTARKAQLSKERRPLHGIRGLRHDLGGLFRSFKKLSSSGNKWSGLRSLRVSEAERFRAKGQKSAKM